MSWYRVSNVPELKNPRQVEAGQGFSCALDDNGVICWGDSEEIGIVPPLRRPISISVGWRHACAIDMDGVKCWGRNDSGQAQVPDLKF